MVYFSNSEQEKANKNISKICNPKKTKEEKYFEEQEEIRESIFNG